MTQVEAASPALSSRYQLVCRYTDALAPARAVLALRVDLSGAPTVAELLGRVKAKALQAQQHQDIPFEQVVEQARPTRSLAHSPLFQVMFAWQNAPEGKLELPGLELSSPYAREHVTAKFDLTLLLHERGNVIAGGLEYATSVFDRTTIERMLGHLPTLLEAMAADESRPVETLPLMSEDEQLDLIRRWNDTDAAYPNQACIHELFEKQVRRAPDALAIVQDDRTLSYADLNAASNRLARELRLQGVGPDARVGICVERSFDMLVAPFVDTRGHFVGDYEGLTAAGRQFHPLFVRASGGDVNDRTNVFTGSF